MTTQMAGRTSVVRTGFYAALLGLIGVAAFVAGLAWSVNAKADEATPGSTEPRVIYPKKTNLEFEGMSIEGEIRNPGEFYFQHRPEEKFDSLVKRRKNFHREMMRDVVLSK